MVEKHDCPTCLREYNLKKRFYDNPDRGGVFVPSGRENGRQYQLICSRCGGTIWRQKQDYSQPKTIMGRVGDLFVKVRKRFIRAPLVGPGRKHETTIKASRNGSPHVRIG